MSLEEDAGYALSKEGTDPLTISAPEEMLTGDPLSRLTRREAEVMVIVARGFTNRQISTELGIS
jgi:DNA-binding NarL/FixJ family response regulator